MEEMTYVHVFGDCVDCKGTCRVGGGRQDVVFATNDDDVGCVASTLGTRTMRRFASLQM